MSEAPAQPDAATPPAANSGGAGALKREPAPADRAAPTAPNAVSAPGWFGWQFPFGIGVATVGAAALRAAITANDSARAGGAGEAWWWAAGRVALLAPMGAALGFLAVFAFAKIVRRPLGDAKLAAARMLAAVGLFHLVWRIAELPVSWEWYRLAFAFSLGLACYLGAVALTFRLRRDELLQVTGLHAALVLVAHAVVWIVPSLFSAGAPKTTEPVNAPPIPSATQTRPAPPAEQPAEQPPQEPPVPAPAPAPAPAQTEPPPSSPGR